MVGRPSNSLFKFNLNKKLCLVVPTSEMYEDIEVQKYQQQQRFLLSQVKTRKGKDDNMHLCTRQENC